MEEKEEECDRDRSSDRPTEQYMLLLYYFYIIAVYYYYFTFLMLFLENRQSKHV